MKKHLILVLVSLVNLGCFAAPALALKSRVLGAPLTLDELMERKMREQVMELEEGVKRFNALGGMARMAQIEPLTDKLQRTERLYQQNYLPFDRELRDEVKTCIHDCKRSLNWDLLPPPKIAEEAKKVDSSSKGLGWIEWFRGNSKQ